MAELLASSDFWVLVSFAGLIGLIIYFRVPALAAGWLDARGEAIGKEIKEAEAILRDAKKILAENKTRAREIGRESEAIVAEAEADARREIEAREAAMKENLTRAEAALEAQLAQTQREMVEAVRNEAMVLALKAARQLLAEKTQAPKTSDDLFAEALAQAEQAVEKHH